MSESLNQILARVASGELTAEQAAARIAALNAGDDGAAVVRSTGRAKPPRRLAIRAQGRAVQLRTDASVADVVVRGEHQVRRSPGRIELSAEGELAPHLRRINPLNPPTSLSDLRGSVEVLTPLVVRLNPDLIVDAEITGGSVTADNLTRVDSLRLTGGFAALAGVHQVCDALIQAGYLRLSGPLDRGRSRIRVESGDALLVLADDADVAIQGRAQWGRIVWPDGSSGTVDEYLIGEGAGRLDLAVMLGQIRVRANHDWDDDNGDGGDDDGIVDAEVVAED